MRGGGGGGTMRQVIVAFQFIYSKAQAENIFFKATRRRFCLWVPTLSFDFPLMSLIYILMIPACSVCIFCMWHLMA
jgi:hypothetical protein